MPKVPSRMCDRVLTTLPHTSTRWIRTSMIYCMEFSFSLGCLHVPFSLVVYYHHVWLFVIVPSIGITVLRKWSRKIHLLAVGLLIDLFSVSHHHFLGPLPIFSIRFFPYPEKYQKTLTGRACKVSKYVVFSSPIFPMSRFFWTE